MEDEGDGPSAVEMFKLELPEEHYLNADNQLHYSSEMISIDEFESLVEEERIPLKSNNLQEESDSN